MKFLLTMTVFLLLVPCLASEAQKGKRFHLELYGGFAGISADDLNSLTDYDRSVFDYLHGYYSGQNSMYHPIDPVEINGGFKSLTHLWSAGGRLRFTLSKNRRGPSISLGLEYSQDAIGSGASLEFEYDDFYQGRYSIRRTTDPQRIWAETFTPMLGFHYPVIDRGRFSSEIHVAVGVVLASCGTFKANYYRKSETTGYEYAWETLHKISGTGTGAALEAGLRIQLEILKDLDLFVEGGYTIRKVENISGEGYFKENDRDSNQDGYSTVSTWEGDWVLVSDSYGRYPQVSWSGISGSSQDDFRLDLSTFYLRIGFSWRLF